MSSIFTVLFKNGFSGGGFLPPLQRSWGASAGATGGSHRMTPNLPSSGPSKGRVAPIAPPLMSNVTRRSEKK